MQQYKCSPASHSPVAQSVGCTCPQGRTFCQMTRGCTRGSTAFAFCLLIMGVSVKSMVAVQQWVAQPGRVRHVEEDSAPDTNTLTPHTHTPG
jgi:hypothetical protein